MVGMPAETTATATATTAAATAATTSTTSTTTTATATATTTAATAAATSTTTAAIATVHLPGVLLPSAMQCDRAVARGPLLLELHGPVCAAARLRRR